MPDLEEQRKKVEELKKKILEQKKKESNGQEASLGEGEQLSHVQESPTATPSVAHRASSSPAVSTPKTSPAQTTPPQQPATTVTPLQAYAQALRQAFADGVLSKDEEVLLATLRKTLNIRPEDHAKIVHDIQMEIYVRALVESWQDGAITENDMEKLEQLRDRLKISAEEHLRLEKMVRQKLLKRE